MQGVKKKLFGGVGMSSGLQQQDFELEGMTKEECLWAYREKGFEQG